MPQGSEQFTQAPISEHVFRHGYPVRRLLDLATAQAEGAGQ
ncbi:hypothetical protein ACFQ7B_43595 [Streptomyces erythrochromogenes]